MNTLFPSDSVHINAIGIIVKWSDDPSHRAQDADTNAVGFCVPWQDDSSRCRSVSAMVRLRGLYLIGYCHLRKEPRIFAVERIKSVTPTDFPYQIPLHFDFDTFIEDSLTVMRVPAGVGMNRVLASSSPLCSGVPHGVGMSQHV